MFQAVIKDFQSLDEAKINVDGVTIIVGETNCGKSACLRAIQAAATNRFKQGQVKEGKEVATVSMRFDTQGQVITVQRHVLGGSPRIKLGPQVYTKLGRTLPKEVSDFLNIASVNINGEQYSCTFHPQFSKPILLEYSQQKVMEILSASVEFSKLKVAKEIILSDRAKCKGAIESVNAMVIEQSAKVLEHKKNVETYGPLVSKLKTLNDEYNTLFSKCNRISTLVSCKRALKVKSDKQSLYNRVLNLSTSISAYKDILANVAHYSTLSLQLSTINIKLKLLKDLQSKLIQSNKLDKCNRKVSLLQSSIKSKEQIAAKLVITSKLRDLSCKALTNKSLLVKYESLTAVKRNMLCLRPQLLLLTRITSSATKARSLRTVLNNIGIVCDKRKSLRIINSQINRNNLIIENHVCPICGSEVTL